MSENIFKNSTSNNANDTETEDGEIDERPISDIKIRDSEIEYYYSTISNPVNDLRCSCCGDTLSDAVKLKCSHLIDRSCAAMKKNGNIIKCILCHQSTNYDEIDNPKTDLDMDSNLHIKPESILVKISKLGDSFINSKSINDEKKTSAKCTDDECGGSDDGSLIPKKRQRKTRWDNVEENNQNSVSGTISDILSTHNSPKNITMSQFKKFTEISSKSSIMNLLTEALLHSVNDDSMKKSSKKSILYSDSDILEMMPSNELNDFFELEKTQLIMLYRDALDKGAILPPINNKSPKQPLLPTPKPSSDDSIKSKKNDFSPKSPIKYSSSESSDSEFSDKSSVVSSNLSDRSHKLHNSDLIKLPKDFDDTKKLINSMKIEPKVETTLEVHDVKPFPKIVVVDEEEKITKVIEQKKVVKETVPSVADGFMTDDAVRYRESVNRLHSIYSSMYHASIKMKELEKQVQSTEYKQAYKTYSENYSEYQKLYSSLQTAINIDSVVTDKMDSDSVLENVAVVNHEQASSTISPCNYAPDSTESVVTNKRIPDNTNVNSNRRSRVGQPGKCDVPQNLSELRQHKKQRDNRKKFGYLWISNLCKETKTNDLCNLFSKFGHVSKIKLFQYKAQTPMTFFSLIFMPNIAEAEKAFRELQNTPLQDRHIHIKMLENNPLADDRIV